MRLRGWHVEGFGLLHDFRVENLPDGLTVVSGPNEAGKSSLLAFIRGALFGYPDKRKKERQYPPLRGGRHGGRLQVEADGATWIVERFASPAHLTITQPEGSLGTEGDLRRLLGGVDAELHRNVFAFSLSELQEFETLQVEGVKDRIFAAGVVGAGRSARSAIEAFASLRAELGRKRGECRINTLRKQVGELDEKLAQAKAQAALYPGRRRAVDELDEAQKRVGRALSDARRELSNLDARLSAWPDWDERGQTEAELAALPATPELPDDFGARLDLLLAAAKTQHERQEERQQTVVELEQHLAGLVPDERLAAVSGEVKRLAARLGAVRAGRARLTELKGQHDALHARIEEEALRLGAGWTSKSVREFDTSIPAAQEIADFGERLRKADEAAREAGERLAGQRAFAQELADEGRLERRVKALAEAPILPDVESLAAQERAARELRTKLVELAVLQSDLGAAQTRLADLRQEAERRAAPAVAAIPKRQLLAAALLLGGLAVALWLSGQAVAAWVVAALLAVGAAFVAALFAMRSPLASPTGTEASASRIAQAERGVQELSARGEALARAAKPLAAKLELSSLPDQHALDERADALAALARVRQERDRETLALDELRRRLDAAAASTKRASEAVAKRQDERDATQAAWSVWKVAHQCPEALRPETAQHFFASVERLRESLARLDGLASERALLAVELGDFSRGVQLVAEQGGLAHAPQSALAEDVLENLRERVAADVQLRAERARTARECEKARSARDASERDAGAAKKAVEQVLAQALASDEQDCRARIATSSKRADLKKRAREAEHRLRMRLGTGAQAEAIRAELASGDRQGWEARRQECKATLAKTQPAHEEALRRHQTEVEALSALERACDIVALATDREGVIAELREALSEWRRLAIAQSLVQGTLRRYELERQPQVLTRAAATFSRITNGRYTRLIAREEALDLLAADGSRMDAAALSRGTAEQLYLCLRLALAAEFGRLAVPLPLIMDDVLVNFDPERARLAAQVLLDATPDHQLLLFTCHPETVALLRGLAPDVNVVELHRESAGG